MVYDNINERPGGFQGDVTVINNSGTTITGWEVEWSFSAGQQITQLWNGEFDQSGANVSVTNASWNPVIGANGGSVNFGFLASWQGSNPDPTAFTLNGVPCTAG